jgi:hypothetical protein
MKKPVIQIPISRGIAFMLLIGLTAGCSKPPDERVVEMAKQSLETQARQNDRLVEQNKQVIEASKELVAADAKARAAAETTVERNPMPSHWDWPLDAPLTIKLPAKSFDWKPTDIQPLPPSPVEGTAAETIRLVPYGCTKFRISMFPVTSKAWGKRDAE